MLFGKRVLRTVLLTACTLFASQLASASIILDAFNIRQRLGVAPDDLSTATTNTNRCELGQAGCMPSAPGAAPIIGGDREFFIERSTNSTSSENVNNLAAYSGNNAGLFYTTGSGVSGRAMVTWDGNVAPDTLASAYGQHADNFDNIDLDFNAEKVYKITMSVKTELGVTLGLRFYGAGSTPGNEVYTQQFKVITGIPNVTQIISFMLTDFVPTNGTNAAIFSHVRAYQLLIDSFSVQKADADATITFFQATSVPEPATMAIAGFALVGIASVARRRRSV